MITQLKVLWLKKNSLKNSCFSGFFEDVIVVLMKEICQLHDQYRFKSSSWLGAADHKKESWCGVKNTGCIDVTVYFILLPISLYHQILLFSSVWNLTLSENKIIDFYFWKIFPASSGGFLDNIIKHHQRKADQ